MNLDYFFNFKTKTVSKAAAILGISSLISRFLGLLREYLLAKNFGASPELDAYFAAFRIPDFVYNILILGGIVVAFLPLFSKYFSKNKEEAWQFTNNILNIFLFFLIFLCIILSFFTPSLIRFVAPGFSEKQFNLAVILTRIMFLSPIFFGLSSVFSGLLQFFDRFLIYSLCPILYNIGIIFGILFLTPFFGIFGVAVGVILGAFLHFLIQIPSAINCGFKYKPIFNLKDKKIKETFFLMIPRTFATAANQINLVVITAIASTLTPGSISIFNFANNLQYFPIGIIGVSFAVAVFPALSRSWIQDQKKKFAEIFSSVFCQILYLIIPFTCLIFILRNQIIDFILKHGQFTQISAHLTAASLGLFSFSIPFIALIPLIYRAFFSLHNTKTPTKISVISVGFNIALSFLFVWLLKPFNQVGIGFQHFLREVFLLQKIRNISILGLPLAITFSSIFQFILSIFLLRKRIDGLDLRRISHSLLKIFWGSFFMIFVLRFFLYLTKNSGIFLQILIPGLSGILVYLIVTYLSSSPEIKGLTKFKEKNNLKEGDN